MSWEPAWVPDGRGGFRRNHAKKNNEDMEEGEESGEMQEPNAEKKMKGDDDEEEGEITPLPSSGGPSNSGSGPARSSSTGNLDFRTAYRGRGSNNSRFAANRDRPRQRNSFSGTTPSQRYSGSNSSTGSGFSREGSFSVGGNSAMPFPSRDSQPPPPPPPPSGFRESSNFRESHNARDIMDGPPPRTGRDFRDFGSGQPSGNLRGDAGSFAGRDFRSDQAPLNRDFSDGPTSRDFRGEQTPPPSRDSRDLRVVDATSFRSEPPVRDFREPPLSRDFRGPPGPPEPSNRDYRNDPSNRDFRGSADLSSRDYRADLSNRDFRDRNESISLGSRDFRAGNQPSKRDVFGRDTYQNQSPSTMASSPGDNREVFSGPSSHREQTSFGANKVPNGREQSSYRDCSTRNPSFREGEPRESTYREVTGRETSFREGSRDTPFRDAPSRDPRESVSKDLPFQGISRDRDPPFTKRENPPPNPTRETGRDQTFGNRDPYTSRGENLVDRARPTETQPFENQKGDHKREASFGSGVSLESNFVSKRPDSGAARDQGSRIAGSSSGRIVAPFHRDGGRDATFHTSSTNTTDRESSLGKSVSKSAHHRTTDIALAAIGSNSASPPSVFSHSAAGAALGIGLQVTNVPAAARPTDPRRRPSKELTNPVVQQGIQAILPTQDGSGKVTYSHAPDAHNTSNLSAGVECVQDKPPIPPPSHPARRMGSYSSLADNSSMPPALMPTPPGPPDRTSSAGSRLGPGGYRSPMPRRSVSEASPRSERGEYYGPSAGSCQQSRLRSPANDRARTLITNPASSPNKAGVQIKQAQPGVSQHLPLAPVMTGRTSHFRQNDPRFKHHERIKADQEAAYALSSTGRLGEGTKNKGQLDCRSEAESSDPYTHDSNGALPSDETTVAVVNLQKLHVDTFGRIREWVDGSKATNHRSPNSVPESPSAKHGNKMLTTASGRDQTSPPVGPPQDIAQKLETDIDAAEKVTEQHTSNLIAARVDLHQRTYSGSHNIGGGNHEHARNKTEEMPPLLTSSLGDRKVIERADAAVQELGLVVSNVLSKETSNGEQSKLPTKQQIMAAVTELEKMIKESQKALEDASKTRDAVRDSEEEEFRRETERLEAEKQYRLAEKQQRSLQQREEEENLKIEGLRKAIEESQDLFMDARKKLEEELEDQISQAKDDEKKRCYQDMESQMSSAATVFDKDIAKAKRDLEKAKSVAQNVEAKAIHIETQYRALLEAKDSSTGDHDCREGDTPPSITGMVASITADNKRKAAEAQMLSLSMLCDNREAMIEPCDETLQSLIDPIHGRTFEEWSILANRVTGLSDALYTEPSESPFFEKNKRTHVLTGPSVKEYIRDKRQRLLDHWTQLAEEYEVRKRLYEKQQKKLTKKAQRGSISVTGRKSILGNKESGERPSFERVGAILESSSRPSNNPYRRARRGNEVRSEYEQDLIIAEIAAKEAMERRITHGSSKLPRQVCRLERELSASYVNTFTAHKVDDPLQEAEIEAITNVWSDMEKCIFFDRFLQFPKDFRRIASFLRNKTTKDCVAFYYDSKQTVQYKGALKEHMMRRKRRGDYHIWDASIQSAISVGAVVTAGSSTEKPIIFSLPESDRTFFTRCLHPLRRTTLDSMRIDEQTAKMHDPENYSEEHKPKSRKRSRDPLFFLEKEHTKFLCQASQDSLSGQHFMRSTVESNNPPSDDTLKLNEAETAAQTPIRKAPQKWTAAEKKVFLETLEAHGRDWAMLSKAVGTKSISQIKNFYYDFKKQSGKYRSTSEKKMMKSESSTRDTGLSPRETPDNADSPKKADIDYGPGPKNLLGLPPGPPVEASRLQQHEDSEKYHSAHAGTSQTSASQTNQSVSSFSLGSLSRGVPSRESAEPPPSPPSSSANPGRADANEFVDNSRVLLQQLFAQQLQQQQHQDLGQQQQPIQQHPHMGQSQSAIQQLLGQHNQRDQQQPTQNDVEEVQRLLQQHQSQSHHQQAITNLLPWVTASHLLQSQPRLQHQHPEGSQMSGVPEINDVASIQRLLQMQQTGQTQFGVNSTSHNPLASLLISAGGLGATANSGISSALLTQFDQLGASAASGTTEPGAGLQAALNGGQSLDNLSAMANSQGLLGFGAPNHLQTANSGGINGLAGSGLYRQTGGNNPQTIDASGVSDALSLLTGAMARRESTSHGFGGVPDMNDGGNRFQ